MINPYFILGIHQNATKKEIQKAVMKLQLENRKTKIYTGNFIINCQRILLDPSKRLAADYLFPTKLKSYRPKKIQRVILEGKKCDVKNNSFSMLKSMIAKYEKR